MITGGGSGTLWPIKHVVFLIKENRTFDNLFGTFPGADGVSFGFDDGKRRPLTLGTDGSIGSEDIPHCYPCSRMAWNHGKMDGFSQDAASERWAYTQLRRAQLPNYWEWASRYVLGDNFFSSAQGPSFPNHLYAIAAQSGGAHDNPRRTGAFRSSNTFGCDAPKGQTVTVVDSEGKEKQVQPCFEFQTEGDLLNDAGVDWAYYAADPDQLGLHLVRVRRDRPHPHHAAVAGSRPAGRPRDRTTSRRTGCRPSPGSLPATRSPSIRSTASARARTGRRR